MTLASNSTANSITQMGRRVGRVVMRVSIKPGTDWRWRSVSDFFKASRMKDMDVS
jgi:hypothetical protein